MSEIGSTRVFSSTARRVVSVGLRHHPGKDLYHHLLTASWKKLFALVAIAYVGSNAAFAAGYLALGDVIENARRGNFWDAFFFSVQTMATIGFGKMAPRTMGANVLVTVEAFFGLLGLALVTGLIFTKFSRPRPRVLFSRVAVVAPHQGTPALMFRMANERSSHIVDAKLEVMLVRNEPSSEEAEMVRRAYDLPLWRGSSALFTHTWTAIHAIDAKSPLAHEDATSLAEAEAEIIVSLVGFDDALSSTIHARHVYGAERILWNVRFRGIVQTLANGVHRIDYRKFHDVVPVEAKHSERTTGRRPARG